MVKYRREFRRLHQSIWRALALLILLGFLLQNVAGSAYYSLLMQSNSSVTSPSVVLQAGSAGSSTIYAQNTSALTSFDGGYWTYYPSGYSVVTGTYVSGSVSTSVQSVDSDYFVVRSSASGIPTSSSYNPSNYSLVGSTTLDSGTTADLVSNNGAYMTFKSYTSAISAQTLYAHQETTSIGGSTYYFLRLSNPNAGGTTLTASSDTTGRKLMGKFVYQLTGVSNISSSTWTIDYRARTSNPAVSAHGDIDILIRIANGTVRTTRATNVADSGAIGNSWSTVSGTYSWTAYTVVDQTDYLEIDYYIEVTTAIAGSSLSLRIDDSALTFSLATKATNINLPSQFTSEVEFTGSSNTYAWTQLDWTVDSAWDTGSVAATLQLYNYSFPGGYPTSGDGYISYTSSSTANTDETKTQSITVNPQNFRDASGNWKIKIKGVKSTGTQFKFKADWIEFKTTYYNEYTASTEFTFSNMTSTTPSQLNFTVVSQYDIGSVSVTIQVYNYTGTPSYPTSGEGCLNYTSSSSPDTDETKILSITVNPQDFVSSGNAKIKITGKKTTQTQFQQKTNQLKLDYKSAGINYNYVLKVVNQGSDAWQVRLTAFSDLNINRLQNLTIYVYDGSNSTQLIVLNGAYNQQTGPWYNLDAYDTEYMWVHVETSNIGTTYIYTYLEVRVPDTTTYAQYVITFKIT